MVINFISYRFRGSFFYYLCDIIHYLMKMNVILIVVGSVLLAVGVFRSIAERKREAQNVVRFEKPSQKPFVYNIDMDSLNHAGDAPNEKSLSPWG